MLTSSSTPLPTSRSNKQTTPIGTNRPVSTQRFGHKALKFKGPEDEFFSTPVYRGDPYKALSQEIKNKPEYKEIVKNWKDDASNSKAAKATRISMAGLGGLIGMFIDAHTGNPDPNNSVGGTLGGMAGAFGTEMAADIVAFCSKPDKVLQIEGLDWMSNNIGPSGHVANLSKNIKDHVNGKSWFYPFFAQDGESWGEHFASASSKEQSYIKGMLKEVQGKGSRSRKLADGIRTNLRTSQWPPDMFTFDAHGNVDDDVTDVDMSYMSSWENMSLLGIKDRTIVERQWEALEHLRSKQDAIADYIEG